MLYVYILVSFTNFPSFFTNSLAPPSSPLAPVKKNGLKQTFTQHLQYIPVLLLSSGMSRLSEHLFELLDPVNTRKYDL